MTWQPEDTEALQRSIKRMERDLPGWWWQVGACHVSADASIGPDSDGPAAYLLAYKHFDVGFHCDVKQPSSVGLALDGAIEMALAAIRELESDE